jgi:hypothetical protein
MSKDKRLTAKEMLERDTMAIMGDEDSVTGFLIAGWFIFCSNGPSVIILSLPFASQRVLKPLNLPTSDLSVF